MRELKQARDVERAAMQAQVAAAEAEAQAARSTTVLALSAAATKARPPAPPRRPVPPPRTPRQRPQLPASAEGTASTSLGASGNYNPLRQPVQRSSGDRLRAAAASGDLEELQMVLEALDGDDRI